MEVVQSITTQSAASDNSGQGGHLIPIHGDAVRSGKGSYRDPGLGIGEDGDPMFTVMAAQPHMVAQEGYGLSSFAGYKEGHGGFRTEPGEHLVTEPAYAIRTHSGGPQAWNETLPIDDVDLLPLGLDSHRYRCCGNGVVSNVAEWIGWRLREVLEL